MIVTTTIEDTIRHGPKIGAAVYREDKKIGEVISVKCVDGKKVIEMRINDKMEQTKYKIFSMEHSSIE